MPQSIGHALNSDNQSVLRIVSEGGAVTDILETVWSGESTVADKVAAINDALRAADMPADIRAEDRDGLLVIATGV